ncbi:hypothetical protein BDZ89DRAFT_1139604 [Hymenopellis radicata]|nr:hypothetical protein BDZ89DRAFT_1139604 [Hymenopellis radicata]
MCVINNNNFVGPKLDYSRQLTVEAESDRMKKDGRLAVLTAVPKWDHMPSTTTTTSLDMKHFTFAGKLEDVTSTAPDTEFALFRLQDGKTSEDAGCWELAAWGLAFEEKGLYLLALGWESKELHESAMKDAAYMHDVLSFRAVVGLVSFTHVSIRKFQ